MAQVNEMHIGGNPSFEMMDDKRTAINQAALEVLTGIGDIHSKLEYLCSLRGRIFNLNNAVPELLGTQIKAALSDLILAATQSIAQSPNRSMAQYTLDAAGPRRSTDSRTATASPTAGSSTRHYVMRLRRLCLMCTRANGGVLDQTSDSAA